MTVSKRKTKKPKRKMPPIVRPKPEPVRYSPEYERVYYLAMEKSLIFHPEFGSNPTNYLRPYLGSLSGLQTLRDIWSKRGDTRASGGKHNKFGPVHLAEMAVEKCEEQFEHEKEEARMGGRRVPDYMSASLFTRYEEAKAELDCAQKELAELKGRIRLREKQDKVGEFKPILPRGPIGTGVGGRGGNPLISLDGQMISFRDGEAIISDKRSPYHNMKVVDYREKVVSPYHESQPGRGLTKFPEIDKKDLPPRPKGY